MLVLIDLQVRKLLVYRRLSRYPLGFWVLSATGHPLVAGDEVVRQGQEFSGGCGQQDGPETVWCLSKNHTPLPSSHNTEKHGPSYHDVGWSRDLCHVCEYWYHPYLCVCVFSKKLCIDAMRISILYKDIPCPLSPDNVTVLHGEVDAHFTRLTIVYGEYNYS